MNKNLAFLMVFCILPSLGAAQGVLVKEGVSSVLKGAGERTLTQEITSSATTGLITQSMTGSMLVTGPNMPVSAIIPPPRDPHHKPIRATVFSPKNSF